MSPQVSNILPRSLAAFTSALVWMVSPCVPIFNSSSLFSNHLVTVPSAPIRTVTFMYPVFFRSLAWSRYLSLFSTGEDKVISLYNKITENFVQLVLKDVFLVMQNSFFRVVKSKFLALFPFNQTPHPVVSILIVSFASFCCIPSFCDLLLPLYHHITNICYFVTFYLFFLWYSLAL